MKLSPRKLQKRRGRWLGLVRRFDVCENVSSTLFFASLEIQKLAGRAGGNNRELTTGTTGTSPVRPRASFIERTARV